MRVRWIHSGCSAEQKQILARAWEDVEPAVQDRLDDLGTQAREIVLAVEHNRGRRLSWVVRSVLFLPSGSLEASAESTNPVFAVDDCIGRIVDQLAEMQLSDNLDDDAACDHSHLLRSSAR